MTRVVIDTNIFVSAILNKNGAPRDILRLAFTGGIVPLMGNALFSEYEDVLSRNSVFEAYPLGAKERQALFEALLSVSVWVPVYYLWRPNLPDESDNHLVELALAGGAKAIVSANRRDLTAGELRLDGVDILTAGEFLKERSTS